MDVLQPGEVTANFVHLILPILRDILREYSPSLENESKHKVRYNVLVIVSMI